MLAGSVDMNVLVRFRPQDDTQQVRAVIWHFPLCLKALPFWTFDLKAAKAAGAKVLS